MEAEATGGAGARSLEDLAGRLAELAAQLEAGPDEDRATELVSEASQLAAEVGREVERALRAAAEARDA